MNCECPISILFKLHELFGSCSTGTKCSFVYPIFNCEYDGFTKFIDLFNKVNQNFTDLDCKCYTIIYCILRKMCEPFLKKYSLLYSHNRENFLEKLNTEITDLENEIDVINTNTSYLVGPVKLCIIQSLTEKLTKLNLHKNVYLDFLNNYVVIEIITKYCKCSIDWVYI